MKTLIVVSGGDAPGINTTIARYLALCADAGDEVLGAQGGFAGVLSGEIHPLSLAQVAPMAGQGGSFLASSREPVLAETGAQEKLRHVIGTHEIDQVLLFGGNGTLKYIPPLLNDWDVSCIGLPTTIDNDVAGTERTLGFDSACNFAYQAVEGVLATARALPGRIFMVETLGGDTGYLALEVAQGAGAHAVLVPEYDYEEAWFAARLKEAIRLHGHALVVLSEGVPTIPQLQERVPRLTGIRLRYTRLGHAQRGGVVTHRDRRLALDMARLAYKGFRDGSKTGTVVVRSEVALLRQGLLDEPEPPPPDFLRYKFINGLENGLSSN